MNRFEISGLSKELDSRLSSKKNRKNMKAALSFALKDGKKISKMYEDFLSKCSLLTDKEENNKARIEKADGHYDYAIHAVMLRIYFYLCYEQDPETGDELDYLALALEQSEIAVKHFEIAHGLYRAEEDKKTTQAQWNISNEYHQCVIDTIAQRQKCRESVSSISKDESIIFAPDALEVNLPPKKRCKNKYVSEGFTPISLTCRSSESSFFSGPLSSFSSSSIRTPKLPVNLSSLESTDDFDFFNSKLPALSFFNPVTSFDWTKTESTDYLDGENAIKANL